MQTPYHHGGIDGNDFEEAYMHADDLWIHEREFFEDIHQLSLGKAEL
jgi:hypothetical protein